MIKRTIEISQRPVHLTVRHGQLLLLSPDQREDQIASIPCEDIGLVLVEHPGTTYTHAALTTLLDHDAALIICDRKHLPAGLLLPLSQHTEVVWRIQEQFAVKKPLRKQLWRQIVQAKIHAQAQNLPEGSPQRTRLLALARQVRSGDPENVEAQAARVYWSALFSAVPATPLPPREGPGEGDRQQGDARNSPLAIRFSSFHRDPDGEGINALLNYGYAVLRAAVARAIVSAGLLPVLGIHHSNRSNAFCLADDLVEPLRPLVDARVRGLVAENCTELNPKTKADLLGTLVAEVACAAQTGPLMVALHRYVASLVRCYEGVARVLDIPVVCPERPGAAPAPDGDGLKADG
jgi:CRISPR-associated protein Cas1